MRHDNSFISVLEFKTVYLQGRHPRYGWYGHGRTSFWGGKWHCWDSDLQDVHDVPDQAFQPTHIPFHIESLDKVLLWDGHRNQRAVAMHKGAARANPDNWKIKNFLRFAWTDRRYPHCFRQWPYHSKNASYGPVYVCSRRTAGNTTEPTEREKHQGKLCILLVQFTKWLRP